MKTLVSNKVLFIFILISCILNYTLLEFNNNLIRKDNPQNIEANAKSLLYNEMVWSVDNEYYLSPVDNYLNGNGWKRAPGVSKGDYYRRVPGYSIVYFVFVKIFGNEQGLQLLKIFQFLLFVTTIPVIFFLCGLLTNKTVQYLVIGVYSLVPFISNWAFYTLTESITPFLLAYTIYFSVKGYLAEQKWKSAYYSIAGLFFIYLVLTRPYCALIGLVLGVGVLNDFKQKKINWKELLVIGFFPMLGLSIWTIRNYILTNEIVMFEKSYHPQSLDRMKPEFRGLFNLTKTWGEDGNDFNKYHQPLYLAALRGDTSIKYVENVIKAFPAKVVKMQSELKLQSVLKKHQEAVLIKKPYFDSVKALPDAYFNIELEVEKDYDAMVSKVKKEDFFMYWITAPLKYLKRMTLHSNTASTFVFQEVNRKNLLWINGYRYFLFLLHLSLYLSLVINFFIMKLGFNKLIYVYTPFIWIIFFTVFHREIEQRYMLPIMPILFVGLANVIQHFFSFKFSLERLNRKIINDKKK